jgi:hypothetical protein
MRWLVFFALLTAGPALAQSELSLTDVARIFCAGRLSANMAPVMDVLTPDLRKLVERETDIHWQGTPGQMTSCMPVGASGTYDHPESVLAYGLPDGASASDKLVMSFVDDQIRIEDIAFGTGGTLRETLAAPASQE